MLKNGAVNDKKLRYKFIREQQKAYPLKVVCHVMEVSRSGYYKYLQHALSKTHIPENKLLIEVKILAQESQNSYGSRRMAKHLQMKGYSVGRYAARTLIHKAGIKCKQRRRYPYNNPKPA